MKQREKQVKMEKKAAQTNRASFKAGHHQYVIQEETMEQSPSPRMEAREEQSSIAGEFALQA